MRKRTFLSIYPCAILERDPERCTRLTCLMKPISDELVARTLQREGKYAVIDVGTRYKQSPRAWSSEAATRLSSRSSDLLLFSPATCAAHPPPPPRHVFVQLCYSCRGRCGISGPVSSHDSSILGYMTDACICAGERPTS